LSPSYLTQFARAHDRAGFDVVLVGYSSSSAEGFLVALYAAMPRNPDPITMPADLVWSFRGISFAGLVLFWLALGVSFHWLVRERA